jgi:hypothetical protein
MIKYVNVIMVSVFAFTLTGSKSIKQEATEVIKNPIIEIIEEEVNLINEKIDNREELIEAMAFIESGGNPNAIGDLNLGTPSIGLLQIRPIMVREVNRILKKQGLEKRFRNADRKDSTKSIEMFNIWADTYHTNSSYEKMARNWNGGPRGYKNKRTEHYWQKIKNYITLNL